MIAGARNDISGEYSIYKNVKTPTKSENSYQMEAIIVESVPWGPTIGGVNKRKRNFGNDFLCPL